MDWWNTRKANVIIDVLSQKMSEDGHKQVARLWTMPEELVTTNPIL